MAVVMVDKALANAQARQNAIRLEVLSISQEMDRLRSRRIELVEEFEKVSEFVRTWYEMAGIKRPVSKPNSSAKLSQEQPATPVHRRPTNTNRTDVAHKSVEYIRDEGRPLLRREIYERLQRDEIVIHGKDPLMVLSTMLWRSKDIVRRLKGGGYWPVGDPVTPEHTDDIEDLLG